MKLLATAGALVALLGAVVPPATAAAETAAKPPLMTVYKSPTCGCCASWVTYLEERGFEIEVVDQRDLRGLKASQGVRPELASCHTALIDGYVIEGHVPEADIRRLLAERPDIRGLTAPGMPQMSPGMHSIEPKGYDVLAIGRDGGVSVYSRY